MLIWSKATSEGLRISLSLLVANRVNSVSLLFAPPVQASIEVSSTNNDDMGAAAEL